MEQQTEIQHFTVLKSDFSQSQKMSGAAIETLSLDSGQVLVKVEKFALTSNNVTYAATGDLLGYWEYFPGPDEDWGIIPVWGYATVVQSNHDEISVGERLWGYFPMSSHLIMEPENTSTLDFVDQYKHRKNLHSTYNTYRRINNDLTHIKEHEDAKAVLYGLFVTSFLIDDFLASNICFGASQIILISASTKTSIALAHLLGARDNIECIGVTSKRNKDYVENLGLYNQVLDYDGIESLSPDIPTVSVDFSGNGAILTRTHNHFGENLKFSSLIGKSHWKEASPGKNKLPGATPKFFFAPDHVAKRYKEWGKETYNTRLKNSWQLFAEVSQTIYTTENHNGFTSVQQIYSEILEGNINPSTAIICSLDT